MTRNCQHCKTSFAPSRLNQYYCKQSCRQGAYLIRNGIGSSKNSKVHENNSHGINVAGLLNNLQPEMLMQLLSGLAKNPSMTDNVTDKKEETLVNKGKKSEYPSQFVNDGFTLKKKNDKFSSRKHNESIADTVNDYPPCDLKYEGKDTVLYMLEHRLTISIPPNGYVRSLFPHWSNKEWNISLQVNKKMLQIFKRLQKASAKSVISYYELTDCCEQTHEISDGLYSFCVPEDYPFTRFLRLLTQRLTVLTDKVKDRTEIKFVVPEDLNEMMMVLNVQLRTED